MLRPYQDTDCEEVIDAWYAASLVATPFLSAEFLQTERENIRSLWLPQAETWIYESDGRVLGFLSLVENEVGGLFVHPDCQGQGVGRALMDRATTLRDHLYLDVFEDNAIGRRFYDRYGFRFESKHVHEATGRTQLRLIYRPDRTPD